MRAAEMTRLELLDWLSTWAPEGSDPQEMRGYIRQSTGRYLASARLLEREAPRGAKVLEIGSDPYYLPLFLRQIRPDLQWTGTNWGGTQLTEPQVGKTIDKKTGQSTEIAYVSYNVEGTTDGPLAKESYDVALYCEVLEHLFADPVQSLENLHGLLRPGGHLLLTTPNPARLYNLQRLVLRQSFYDPISGYGPYGRHNREYAVGELRDLLENVGFDVVSATTIETTHDWLYRRAAAKLGYGEHHLIWAKRRPGKAKRYRPEWLYRSFEPEFYKQALRSAQARPQARSATAGGGDLADHLCDRADRTSGLAVGQSAGHGRGFAEHEEEAAQHERDG